MYINTLALQFSQENDFWRSVRIYSLGQYDSALNENPVITCGVLGFCACIVQPRLRLEIYSHTQNMATTNLQIHENHSSHTDAKS